MLAWFDVHTAQRRDCKTKHYEIKTHPRFHLCRGNRFASDWSAAPRNLKSKRNSPRRPKSPARLPSKSLSRVPGGTIKEGELERRRRYLVLRHRYARPERNQKSPMRSAAQS